MVATVDAESSSPSPNVLLAETRRVLDAQQRLVDRQQARASGILRLVLTAIGLALTLASLGADTALVADGDWVTLIPGLPAGGPGRTFGIALLAILGILTCRMLCAALVVLEPRTAVHPLARALTSPVACDERPSADWTGLPSGSRPAFRAGLDADATTDTVDAPNPELAVLAYNAGCVAGNAALIEHNRWYLTRVYRSATLAVGLATGALLVVLALVGGAS